MLNILTSEEFHDELEEIINEMDGKEENQYEYSDDDSDNDNEGDDFYESIKQNVYDSYLHYGSSNDSTDYADDDSDNDNEDDDFYESIKQNVYDHQIHNASSHDSGNHTYDSDRSSENDVMISHNQSSGESQSCEQYIENISILDSGAFSRRESEILEIKQSCARALKKRISPNIAYGIKNLGKSCYFNVFIQMLVYIPDSHLYLQCNLASGNAKCLEFIRFFLDQVIAAISTVNPAPYVNDEDILACINSPYYGAPLLLIRDFFDTSLFSCFELENGNIFKTIQDQQGALKDVVVVYRDNQKEKQSLKFPLSFQYNDHSNIMKKHLVSKW